MEFRGAFSASALSFLATLVERWTGTSGNLREMSFIPKTLGHCTAFQFGLNTRELISADESASEMTYIVSGGALNFTRSLLPMKTGPLAIPTFDFSFRTARAFLTLGIYSAKS